MKRILIITLLSFFLSEFSFAEVYKWIDEKGVSHFTDDINQVPVKYRSKAEKMGLSEEKEEKKPEPESPRRTDEPSRDRLGRGEGYWKGLVEEWRSKLRESQDKLESLRVRYNELTEKFNDSKSTAERGGLKKEREQVKGAMDQQRTQIDEARLMLDKKIPEEADLYKAKQEWIK